MAHKECFYGDCMILSYNNDEENFDKDRLKDLQVKINDNTYIQSAIERIALVLSRNLVEEIEQQFVLL